MFLEEALCKVQSSEVIKINIQKNEWRWASLYAIILMVLISMPYLVGVLSQTSTRRFSGAIIGIDDTNTYLAKMNQGALGAWLFTLPYSSEPQKGAPIYWFYLFLGKISGTGFTNRAIVYHLARIVFGFILILTIYRFLAEFLLQTNHRRVALIITTIGGGLGWVIILFGKTAGQGPPPLEFYSPEAFSFLMLLTFPHLLFARSLLLFSLQAFLHHRYIWCSVAMVLLTLIQPVDVVIVWIILGLVSIANLISEEKFSSSIFLKNFQPLLLIGIISFPILLYFGYLFISDPILKQWSAQGIVVSPSPLHFLSSYGPYLVPAILGLKSLKSNRPDLWRLSVVWIFLIPVLIYIPIGFQRRLIEGFQVLLVAIAFLGLTTIQSLHRKQLTPLIMLILIPSSIMLFIGAIQSASHTNDPVFQSVDELSVFNWLNKNAQPNQVVLSAYSTGNLLPAHTSLIPFVGHYVETVFFADKMTEAASFYQPTTDANERLNLIKTQRIAYVFYGPDERKLGKLDPSSLGYLIKRFEQGEYSIYEVIPK